MLFDSDLRIHLRNLEAAGLLRHVTREVDKNWEISSVMRWVYHGNPESRRYAVMFDRVTGYDIPVVVGAIGASYLTYAVSLGKNYLTRIGSFYIITTSRLENVPLVCNDTDSR